MCVLVALAALAALVVLASLAALVALAANALQAGRQGGKVEPARKQPEPKWLLGPILSKEQLDSFPRSE